MHLAREHRNDLLGPIEAVGVELAAEDLTTDAAGRGTGGRIWVEGPGKLVGCERSPAGDHGILFLMIAALSLHFLIRFIDQGFREVGVGRQQGGLGEDDGAVGYVLGG